MSTLILGKPSNLHLPEGCTVTQVESDVYRICDRIAEISSSLSIHLLEGHGDYIYAVFEDCPDGMYRMVKKYKQLDERVCRDMRYFMSKPLPQRLREIEIENAKYEAEWKENQLEELYERMGGPMWVELERCGFIDRPVSYPKVGVSAGGKRAR